MKHIDWMIRKIFILLGPSYNHIEPIKTQSTHTGRLLINVHISHITRGVAINLGPPVDIVGY